MNLNPKNLQWTAPTTRESGAPLTVPLDYELGVQEADGGAINVVMSVVGTLQEDGQYEAPLASNNLGRDRPLKLYLRAIDRAGEGDTDDQRSQWSNGVEVQFTTVPAAPTNFTVA